LNPPPTNNELYQLNFGPAPDSRNAKHALGVALKRMGLEFSMTARGKRVYGKGPAGVRKNRKRTFDSSSRLIWARQFVRSKSPKVRLQK
jgi:hypothetical protein